MGKGDSDNDSENTQPIKIPRYMNARRSKPPDKRGRFLSWLDQRIESIKSSSGYGSSLSSALAVQVLVHVRKVYLILMNGRNGGR
jgi:hypothetical protein